MRRFRFGRPTPAMVVAVIALFVALGGTGYAALKLPPHSVGKKQLKRNAVTTAKVDNNTLRLKDFYRRDLNRLLRRAAAGGEEFEDFEDFEDFDEPLEETTTAAALLRPPTAPRCSRARPAGLPDSGEPVEYASLTGSATANTDATQVASLSPNREFDLSDFSVALSSDVPSQWIGRGRAPHTDGRRPG